MVHVHVYQSRSSMCFSSHIIASDVLKFTKPYKGTQKKIIPGCIDLVLPFKTDALEWHHIWQNCGCRSSGYVFDMRKLSRHNYH